MMNNLKSFIKEKLCFEKQVDVGPISILLCDMMLSFNLKGPDVVIEDLDGSKHLSPSTTYGLTIEPFAFHFMGRDGDVCWTSPGWSLVDWAFREDSENFREVSCEDIKKEVSFGTYEFQFGT